MWTFSPTIVISSWYVKLAIRRIMKLASYFQRGATCSNFFPTCQVRVVRFYQSCSLPPPPHPPPPRSPDPSGHSRTSTASAKSVGTAGPPPRAPDPSGHCPPPRAPDPSGHCRTSTATSRSQWALSLNRDFQIAVGTAGPHTRLPDRSGHCRTSTAR